MKNPARETFMKAFRDATGQEYEAGRDYSAERKKRQKEGWNKYYRDCAEMEKLQKSNYERDTACRARETFMKAFRDATGQEYEAGRDYSGPERTKRGQSDWQQGFDSGIEAATSPHTSFLYKKKGPSMFKSSLKSLPLALVLTAALNGPTIYHSAVDWWTAPTQLELGDWTKIVMCDDCGAVTPKGAICLKCGGECFSEKKGQMLQDHNSVKPFVDWDKWEGKPEGYLFPDGSYTLDPGYWRLPNGEEVRS